MATNENLPPNVIKQLAKELKNLDESPPEGIKVCINNDDFSTIYADIEGPGGTPYENGVFRMKLILSHDFPYSPPEGYFLTKIFHPNVASNGKICVNTLKKDWNSSFGLRHVLLVLRCLLIEPYPESALNEQAGKMLLEDYEEYARLARLYTGIHAKPKTKLKQGTISESTTALNVDQSNSSAQSGADTKSALPSTASAAAITSAAITSPSPSLVGSTTTTATSGKGGASSCDDQPPVVLGPSNENVMIPQKKEGGDLKLRAQTAEKKKIDARKKSLKRL